MWCIRAPVLITFGYFCVNATCLKLLLPLLFGIFKRRIMIADIHSYYDCLFCFLWNRFVFSYIYLNLKSGFFGYCITWHMYTNTYMHEPEVKMIKNRLFYSCRCLCTHPTYLLLCPPLPVAQTLPMNMKWTSLKFELVDSLHWATLHQLSYALDDNIFSNSPLHRGRKHFGIQ